MAYDKYLEELKKVLARMRNMTVEAFEEQERLDLEKQEFDKKLGLLSDADYEARMKTRAIRYREYSNYVMNLSELDEEEKIKLQRKYLTEAKDIELELYKYQTELAEDKKTQIKEAYSEMAKAAYDHLEDVIAAEEKLESKLKNYGTLFTRNTRTIQGLGRGWYMERGTWKDEPDLVVEEFFVTDLSKDIKALEEYRDALYALKEKGGLPKEFFSAVRDLSVKDGTDFANALLALSDEDFYEYTHSWEQKQLTAEEISRLLYEDEETYANSIVQEVENIEQSISLALEGAGISVPEGFFDIGKSSADKFGDGFLERIIEVFSDVQDLINIESAKIVPSFLMENGSYTGYTTNNISNNYNIGTYKNTVNEQLRAIENARELDRLRGGDI